LLFVILLVYIANVGIGETVAKSRALNRLKMYATILISLVHAVLMAIARLKPAQLRFANEWNYYL